MRNFYYTENLKQIEEEYEHLSRVFNNIFPPQSNISGKSLCSDEFEKIKISTNNYSIGPVPMVNEIAKLEAEFEEFLKSKHKNLSSYILHIEKNKTKKTQPKKKAMKMTGLNYY